MNVPFEIILFGKLAFRFQGKYVSLGNRKAEEMVARLALQNGLPMSKLEMADLLWPRVRQEQAMDSLYKVCAHIRALERDGLPVPFSAGRGTVKLDIENVWCDTTCFNLYMRGNTSHLWEEAVSLYRGPLLSGDFFEWSSPWEAFFAMRYLELLEKLIKYLSKKGLSRKAAFYRAKLEAEG